MRFMMLTCTVGLLSGGGKMECHQCPTSSHSTTLESNKSVSRLLALQTRFQPPVSPRWPASEHSAAVAFQDHPAVPFLRPSAAGATAGPETRIGKSNGILAPVSPGTHPRHPTAWT